MKISKNKTLFSTLFTAFLIIESEKAINKIPLIINPILNKVNTDAAQ
jgi:hypothetical protein